MIDGDLSLEVAAKDPGNPEIDYVPSYTFTMIHQPTNMKAGRISLRLGEDAFLVNTAGQIGYGVAENFRGRRYASRSIKLILPLAKRHGFTKLWITCNPSNIASKRTCELAGFTFLEEAKIPRGCDMYRRGERTTLRYYIDL